MPRIIEGKEMNLIGDRLRVLRKKHHLSQQQLSERLETQAVYICRGSISRIEDKSRTVTDIELMGLAKVLGVKIQDLLNSVIFPLQSINLLTYCAETLTIDR